MLPSLRTVAVSISLIGRFARVRFYHPSKPLNKINSTASKAQAYADLREAIKELSIGAGNTYEMHEIAQMEAWNEEHLQELTSEQLMALAKIRYLGSPQLKQDEVLAAKAWQVASDRGVAEASYSLAACLREGKGVDKDPDEAYRLLSGLAANHDHPHAHYACGIMLSTGEGTNRDDVAAFGHFESAARHGIPPALYNMGNMYASGTGVTKSESNALTCYEMAAAAGDQTAKYMVGVWLCEGRGCEVRDVERGIQLQKESAEAGHVRAAHNLGCYYLSGDIVPKDVNEAIKWLSMASSKGMFPSTFNLGMIYFEGNEVKKDMKQAAHYFALCTVQDRNNPIGFEYLNEARKQIELNSTSMVDKVKS